uniref:Uncharacterized protein n=1 Tax=Lepeophtheirus salmonis TaxID=72036 RepID=A0A0K2UJ67_LEPSM
MYNCSIKTLHHQIRSYINEIDMSERRFIYPNAPKSI